MNLQAVRELHLLEKGEVDDILHVDAEGVQPMDESLEEHL